MFRFKQSSPSGGLLEGKPELKLAGMEGHERPNAVAFIGADWDGRGVGGAKRRVSVGA